MGRNPKWAKSASKEIICTNCQSKLNISNWQFSVCEFGGIGLNFSLCKCGNMNIVVCGETEKSFEFVNMIRLQMINVGSVH